MPKKSRCEFDEYITLVVISKVSPKKPQCSTRMLKQDVATELNYAPVNFFLSGFTNCLNTRLAGKQKQQHTPLPPPHKTTIGGSINM
jgi:hypothetical protein